MKNSEIEHYLITLDKPDKANKLLEIPPKELLLSRTDKDRVFIIKVEHKWDFHEALSGSYSFGEYFYTIYNSNLEECSIEIKFKGWKLIKATSSYDSFKRYSSSATIVDKWGIVKNNYFNDIGCSIHSFLFYVRFLLTFENYEDWENYENHEEMLRLEKEKEEKRNKAQNLLSINTTSIELIDKKEKETEISLNSLIGLSNVKNEVNSLINLMKLRQLRISKNLPFTPSTLHLVFTGNPGTGKTTVARIIAKKYNEIGLLSKGQLIETSRSELVGKYVGHTAQNVKEICESALGGILFIDEAYSLSQGGENDFGKEAIDTLVKIMEDNRENLVIIVAGYPDKMQLFLEANPGLHSRFPTIIQFDDYSLEELTEIFKQMCISQKYNFDDEFINKAKLLFENESKTLGIKFGNARGIRNIFERIIKNQANRLVSMEIIEDNDLITLTEDDIL
jgi:stage V sporulation protein K